MSECSSNFTPYIHHGKRRVNVIKIILREYEVCFSQCVNFEKSIAFFSSNMIELNKTIASQILNVRCSTNPEKYLGLSNMVGRGRRLFTSDSNEYDALFFNVKILCMELESIIGKFWWQKKGGSLVRIEEVVHSRIRWGTGFRSLLKFNVALLAKQLLRLICSPNYLLACMLKAKYFKEADFLNSKLDWRWYERLNLGGNSGAWKWGFQSSNYWQ
ncbi:bZIP-like protein [Gossypium australe]|uniref:BZIP-like protein n=1 Tax=Gossypium australe TaxID=47621 RepID=A0A5B6W532_9ROSI|nr:bZIP-like protein [Gossypium australe]